MRMQFVDILDLHFSDIACSVLSRGNFYAEKQHSTVTKFCHLVLGALVIMPHRVDCR